MGFLERIVQAKRIEAAERRARVPLDELERAAAEAAPVRDFALAIRGGDSIIAEVKRKSPRVAQFRHAANVEQLARLYDRHGAAAVSVVTDAANFGTSLDDAKRIKLDVSIPVLVKDFVIDPYQVYEARAFGADAVLLIARLLEPGALASLIRLTRRLGMHALVEVHARAELDEALEAGAGIVGINNRDLDTLEVDLGTTRELLRYVPGEKTIVSESGFSRREDIDALSSLGVHAFLIGGAFLDSPDPAGLLRELLGRTSGNIAPPDERMRRNA